MRYCQKCGKKLDMHAKYCPECGTAVLHREDRYEEERKYVYAGYVVKCPSCGAELSSFTAICPNCGHEINSIHISTSLRNFIE